eukprot:9598750-Alexandrium_andersonii.AAC.1
MAQAVASLCGAEGPTLALVHFAQMACEKWERQVWCGNIPPAFEEAELVAELKVYSVNPYRVKLRHRGVDQD